MADYSKLQDGDFIVWADYLTSNYTLKDDVENENWDERFEHDYYEGSEDTIIKHHVILSSLLRIIYGIEN